jgi:hypothetical protein
MIAPKTYKTPAGFKVALEDRLKKRASLRNVVVNRVRQRFVMERFLARIARAFGATVTLKGGLALELRLANARSTKDIDLRTIGDPETVLGRLREAAALNLDDHLVFSIDPDREHPTIEDAVYEGRRFRAGAALAGQVYGSPFGVDVAMGDPMHGAPDELVGDDFLDFIGVDPARIAAYPIETHIAEKLHAYTRPPARAGRVNSRVRDLPDLALLASTRGIDGADLRTALAATFAFRATHAVPQAVPSPPPSWSVPYGVLAEEHDLPWRTLGEAHAVVAAFLDPLLGGEPGAWLPARWQWSPRE